MTVVRPIHASHHCRHYGYEGGLSGAGPRCARGVDLSSPAACRACMPEAAGDGFTCQLREEYTTDERAAWLAWREKRTGRMVEIMRQIPGSSTDTKNKPEWGKSGAFPCPVCEWGVIRWARARVNGHLRAACDTPDCFGAIQ